MLSIIFSFLSLFLLSAGAASGPAHGHPRHHQVRQTLPSRTWYHEPEHPVHALFRRDNASSDGANYPTIGSSTWTAAYPSWSTPVNASLPSTWVNALNGAVQSGLIPDIPQSNGSAGQNPTYPSGFDPTSSNICSATYGCRIPGDVWDAPDGVFASAFDDGPTQFTPTLLDFLGSHNRTTTHFMIGNNILWYPSEFQLAINAGHDIGVHTWTHPLMTTRSNLELLGEFGWTMQVIHDSTGGRVPKFWRPPYGDSDLRTRAIAKEIFGLTTVVWNYDTGDYTQNNTAPIEAAMTSF
jgi:hypothetical protein